MVRIQNVWIIHLVITLVHEDCGIFHLEII